MSPKGIVDIVHPLTPLGLGGVKQEGVTIYLTQSPDGPVCLDCDGCYEGVAPHSWDCDPAQPNDNQKVCSIAAY
jgi:hypothetical protein